MLKFRAWDKKHKYFKLIDDLYWFEENYVHKENNESYIIMQYTGIKDEEGKEIYEGDILERTDVVLVAGKCVKTAGNIKDFIMDVCLDVDIFKYDFTEDKITNFKIIGNVCENLELVNE